MKQKILIRPFGLDKYIALFSATAEQPLICNKEKQMQPTYMNNRLTSIMASDMILNIDV